MDVPKVYEPVLPEKVKAHIEKKAAAQSDGQTIWQPDGQTIWYQCVDLPNFWSKDGHKSYKQKGVSAVDAVLSNPKNEGALMITFQDNRHFEIKDGTMLPQQ